MWNRYVVRRKINSLSRRLGCTRAPAHPISAWIVSTTRCNLRCRICGVHGPHLKDGAYRDLEPAVYARVREDLLPRLQAAFVSGGGEPFVAPILDRVLEDLLPSGKAVWIVTNGTIIKPNLLEQLTHSPATITVSIDGATADVVEHIRVGAKFDRILDFLQTVSEMKTRFGHPEFKLTVNCVVTRSNVEQLSDVVELGHRFGVHTVAFSNFEFSSRRDDYVHESLANEPDIVLPHWEQARRRARTLGIHVPPVFFEPAGYHEDGCRLYRRPPDENGPVRRCPLPWWATYIDVDGSVYPCSMLLWKEPMGNILQQPFHEIWNGSKYRRVRSTANTQAMPKPCRHCKITRF